MKCFMLLAVTSILCACSSQAEDYLNPRELKVGSAYVVSRQTPVMPEFEPVDPIAAVGKMKQIPVGGAFKIVGIKMKNGKPWYQVRSITADGQKLGTGFINSTALRGQTLTPYGKASRQDPPPESTRYPVAKSYSIVSSEDLDYRSPSTGQLIRRKEYRVQLRNEHSNSDLKRVAEEVIGQAPTVDAIVVFLYLPDSATTGPFTAGKATWAPDGKWENAGTSYQKRLVMKYEGAMGTLSKEDKVDLPISRKKAMFLTLVRYQDQGMDNDQSYAATARKYGLTNDQVRDISVEGVISGWPMP